MAYNLKKAQKINDSVTPLSAALPKSNHKHDYSLENEKYVTNVNTYLNKDRRELKNGPQTHEAMLDDVRKKSDKAEKTTEGRLSDSDSALYPHRQFEDGGDKYAMMPINMLSEAYDRKWRDAFSKANKKADTLFWDKYIGDQLDDKQNKVLVNMPQEGSQLNANPLRFKDLEGMPSSPDAVENRENFGKKIDIKQHVGFDKGSKASKMVAASLKDADKLLFGIYLKASSEKRNLNSDEQKLVDGINRDKEKMLLTLAQIEFGEFDPADISPDRHNPADILKGHGRSSDENEEVDFYTDADESDTVESADKMGEESEMPNFDQPKTVQDIKAKDKDEQ